MSDLEQIQKFTSDGVFVSRWGGFCILGGIATDADDDVYVIDRDCAVAKKFTTDGVYLTEWGSPGSDDDEFYSIFGIAVGPAGEIYVGDTSLHRIQKFAPSSTPVEADSWARIKGRYRKTP